jgi:hypothetical protein
MRDYFHEQAHNPPPPSPLIVIGRHGAKFKVKIFGLTKIWTADQILAAAAERRKAGAMVQLNGFIREPV